MKYNAFVPNTYPHLTLEDVNKLAKLDWLAMGIYQYLIIHGAKSVEELAQNSPTTPYTEIRKALCKLILLSLVVEEAEVAEVPGGAA